MALFLSSDNLSLTAQDLTVIIHQINRFHLLHREATDYEDQVTAIITILNGIMNPFGFEATITHNRTIIMVMPS